jgi:multidrug resistance efflux pump
MDLEGSCIVEVGGQKTLVTIALTVVVTSVDLSRRFGALLVIISAQSPGYLSEVAHKRLHYFTAGDVLMSIIKHIDHGNLQGLTVL